MSDDRPGITVRSWVLSIVTLGVLLVWAVNVLGGLFIEDWAGDPGVNGVMAGMLGLLGVLGGKTLFARSGGDETPPERPARPRPASEDGGDDDGR